MTRESEMMQRLSSAFAKGTESNNQKLAAVIAGEFDELESNIDDILSSHLVRTASGIHLDRIGKLFDIIREPGESDISLRTRIQFGKIIVFGTVADIQRVVELFAGITSGYRIVEPPETDNATFRIEFTAPTEAMSLKQFYAAINAAKVAGVEFLQDDTGFIESCEAQGSGAAVEMWNIISPYGFGYGASGYGTYGYGAPLNLTIVESEVLLALGISGSCVVYSGVGRPIGYGIGGYGYYSYGGLMADGGLPGATFNWNLTSIAPSESDVEISTIVDLRNIVGYGVGGYGVRIYGDVEATASADVEQETRFLLTQSSEALGSIGRTIGYGIGGYGHYTYGGRNLLQGEPISFDIFDDFAWPGSEWELIATATCSEDIVRLNQVQVYGADDLAYLRFTATQNGDTRTIYESEEPVLLSQGGAGFVADCDPVDCNSESPVTIAAYAYRPGIYLTIYEISLLGYYWDTPIPGATFCWDPICSAQADAEVAISSMMTLQNIVGYGVGGYGIRGYGDIGATSLAAGTANILFALSESSGIDSSIGRPIGYGIGGYGHYTYGGPVLGAICDWRLICGNEICSDADPEIILDLKSILGYGASGYGRSGYGGESPAIACCNVSCEIVST